MRVLSPRMEPPVTRRRGVDGQHRELLALVDQPDAERLDEGGLARAGHPGDADTNRAAGLRQQRGQHLLRPLLVVRPGGFDQRDGLGQRATLTGQHAVHQLAVGVRQEIGTHRRFVQFHPGLGTRLADLFQHALGRILDAGTRAEDGLGTGRVQGIVILRGITPPAKTMMSSAPWAFSDWK